MKKLFGFVLVTILLLSGCNYPTPANSTDPENPNIAELTEEVADEPEDPTVDASPEETETPGGGEPTEEVEETETPGPTEDPGEEGEDQIGEDDHAEFIADVSIPDYSEFEIGEEITKTWRVKNTGTSTWTTSYLLEFEKGEKLGASTQIPLAEEVAPGELVDISIDFRVPTATGEYNSYWILKNEENQRVGAGDEGNYLSLYMIILAVKEDDGSGDDSGDGGDSGSSSGGESISGGANVTGASVSVNNANFQGECPAELSFDYAVTTSNAGKVQFNLVFNVISPSGYKFDPPPQYLMEFTGGYTVNYRYDFSSSNSVNATVRVRAIGANEFLSAPVQFSVNCQ